MSLEKTGLNAGEAIYFVEGEGICGDGEAIVKKGVLVNPFNETEDRQLVRVPEDFTTDTDCSCLGLEVYTADVLTGDTVRRALAEYRGADYTLEEIDEILRDEEQNREVAGVLGDVALTQQIDLDLQNLLNSH